MDLVGDLQHFLRHICENNGFLLLDYFSRHPSARNSATNLDPLRVQLFVEIEPTQTGTIII